MKLTVAKVKTFRGMEGTGYNAELRMDGVPVGYVIDEGCGGEPHIEWKDAVRGGDYEKKILAWVGAQSLVTLGIAKTEDEKIDFGDQRPLTELYKTPWSRLEAMLSYMVDAYVNERKFRRLAKANVIFRKGDKVYTVKIRPGEKREAVEAFVAKKYPDHEIVREYNAA